MIAISANPKSAACVMSSGTHNNAHAAPALLIALKKTGSLSTLILASACVSLSAYQATNLTGMSASA